MVGSIVVIGALTRCAWFHSVWFETSRDKCAMQSNSGTLQVQTGP